MRPIVSVVLPVYNSERYIGEAINSVLRQSFKEFELIVIEDKSTDNTVGVIKAFKDARIRLFLNKNNIGRASSDNFALSVIQGKYIAKMDGDDVCHPQRLEKQVLYLDEHPQVNVAGSWIQSFGSSKYLHKYPAESEDIKCKVLLGMPIGNSSLMLRSRLFLEDGMRYDGSLKHLGEDYDFFIRYRDCLNMHVIQEPLLFYRTYPDSFKQTIIDERKSAVKSVRRKFLEEWGVTLSELEFDLLDLIYNLDEPLVGCTLDDVERLLYKIILYNSKNEVFSQNSLKNFLAQRWFYVCYHYQQLKFGSILKYYKSDLSNCQATPFDLKLKFFYKGLKKIVR